MPNSLSELHTLHAWEDNQITERCTQGEYAGKVLQFKLVDKDGAINLSNCLVQYAVTRPDKTEDLLDCTVDNGVVKCNLTYSVTSVVGLVHGEVRVIGSNDSGIIKFYGVNLRVYKGVSDEAAEQSDEFTALVAALQKVVSITPNPDSENTYVVQLDDSIVQNGLNPVASGTIYDYLQDNYILKSGGMQFIDATNPNSGISSIDDCTAINAIYKINFASGIVATSSSYVMCVRSENKYIQYAFTRTGMILFRSKDATAGSTWSDDWDYIMHDTIENAIVRGFKDVRITQSFNVENALVQTYMDNPDYTDDYSTSYVPAQSNISNSEHGRPNTVSVVAPYSSASICIRDTVTQDELTKPVLGSPYLIDNLIPNRIYAYTFHRNDGSIVSSGTCKATGQVRMINGGGNTFNIRDLGGWSCDGGTIKYGKIYRGCELNGSYFNVSLNSDQIDFFKNRLSIRDEIDLRSNSDREENNITSSALGLGVDYYPIEYKYYQNALTSANASQSANIIKRLAKNLKEDKTTYIHCQAGADRSATLCVLLEAICGVSQSDIDRDYELTSFSWSYYKDGAQTPEWQGRLRSSGTLGYANYKTFIRDVNNLEGNTFQDRIVRFLLRSGVSIDEINDIRFGLIEGNPTALVNPYSEATITKNLSHVFIDNEATSVKLYQPFEANLTVEDWYKLNYGSTTSYEITMSGTDITSNCANGKIRIERVTGNITIKAIAVDNEARIDSRIDDLDSRFELQTTVGFDENGIPVFTSNNTSFPTGACSVESVKTLFIASNVTAINGGAFNTTANQNITTVYIDNKQTDITIQSGAFPSGATIYYKGQFNALGFVIAALENLNTSKLDDANNSVKTNHITDGNVTETKLSSEVQAKINKNTGVYTYTISASNWNNKAQILNLSSVYTVTGNTKVDIEADDTALNQLSIDDCEGIYVENNNGTLTIKAITNSPTENITVQLVVYEVETLS